MNSQSSKRPLKEDYYLDIAQHISRRGTCIRRHYGAVIVKNDQIVSTGYEGAPRKTPNCIDIGNCIREELSVPSGERYELCRSVHAEQNAIINAARAGVSVLGGTMFIAGEKPNGDLARPKPCKLCIRMIINAGLYKVIGRKKGGISVRWKVSDWIESDRALRFSREN